MKHIVRHLFVLAILLSSVLPAHAGFWVKPAPPAATSSAAATNSTAASSNSTTVVLNKVQQLARPDRYNRSFKQSEWVGIGSLVCGLLGLLIPGVNLLAILLGALGLGRGSKVKGLATAGFILGMLELLLFLIFGITFLSLILL